MDHTQPPFIRKDEPPPLLSLSNADITDPDCEFPEETIAEELTVLL